jgi:hypothetical protein
LPATIKHTTTKPSRSALLILIVASFSPRSSRYNDWLGGYPYESAAPDQVLCLFEAFGFSAYREFPLPKGIGLFGTGCCEFVFERHSA